MAIDGARTDSMRLGLFILNTGHHIAAWRHASTRPAPAPPFGQLKALARTAERGLFDAIFLADAAALPDMNAEMLSRTDRATLYDPLTTAAALAVATDRIGIVFTQNTTYDQPYYVARRVLSIDHLSGGRVGCNLVTGVSRGEARNFGHDELPDHADRYARAAEFTEVVLGLWQGWDPDAFAVDQAAGRYFDPAKLRRLDHRGKHFAVEGPLNLPASPQGRPVLVQAGGSPAGQALAARHAEMIYSVQGDHGAAQAFYCDVKTRMMDGGRDPDGLKIMPGMLAVVGRSRAEAADKFAELQDLVDPELGMAFLQSLLGPDLDLSKFDPDEKLPTDLSTNFGTSQLRVLQEATEREGLTLRQLTRFATAARGHWQIHGTAADIADQMEERFRGRAADGFNLMPASIPGGVEDFVELVVPELQRRDLFRTRYTGHTLRDHLGLQTP